MMPSVGPSSSSRRRHSRPTRTRPLSVSSTTGAPNVADTYSPVLAPSAGWVTYSRPAVLMISAASAAIPAPQANAKISGPRGSGSSRSTQSTSATSSGTGSRASGSAMTNGTTPCPAANDSPASMLSATIAQAAVITIPAMNQTLGRPGTRPSITARGSNTGTDGVDSVMCGSILCGPAPGGPVDGARLV